MEISKSKKGEILQQIAWNFEINHELLQRIDSENLSDFVAVLADLWNQKKLKNENLIFI